MGYESDDDSLVRELYQDLFLFSQLTPDRSFPLPRLQISSLCLALVDMPLVVFDEAAVYVDQLQREVEEEERAHT